MERKTQTVFKSGGTPGNRSRLFILVPVVVFLLLGTFGAIIFWNYHSRFIGERRATLTYRSSIFAHNLSEVMNNRATALNSVSSYFSSASLRGEKVDAAAFQTFCQSLIGGMEAMYEGRSGILALAAARQGSLLHEYAVVGDTLLERDLLDLLREQSRVRLMHEESGMVSVHGPMPASDGRELLLLQTRLRDPASDSWYRVQLVLDHSHILWSARAPFMLKNIPARVINENDAVMWENTERELKDPVDIYITVPNAQWRLRVGTAQAVAPYWHFYALIGLTGLVALVIALLISQLYRQRQELEKRVASRTEEVEQISSRLEQDREELHKVEVDLRSTREKLNSIVSSSSIIIFMLDREGRFSIAEGRGLDLLGLEQEKILGRHISEVLAGSPELESGLETCIGGEAITLRYKQDAVALDIWISPILGKDGDVTGIHGVALDMSSNLELEEQLLQSQKMEAVGRLAGGVAHDFNNLLTAIRGHGELAQVRLSQQGIISEDLEEIRSAAERASALTSQLLTFSRKHQVQPEVLDLNSVVRAMDRMLRRIIGEDISFLTHLEKDLWSIKADRTHIEQIVMNLLVNARDAMPRGGTVTLETCNVQLADEITDARPPISPGDYVRVVVSDTGVGMDDEVQAKVFDPFFTTKSADKGTGLGLSTVYSIVQQIGGGVMLESAPGKGTVFLFYFPRCQEQSAVDELTVEQDENAAGTETVLLVEDDPYVRKLAQQALMNHGYAVVECGSAEEALERFGTGQRQGFSLVIIDIVLPDIDGFELSEILKEKSEDVRFLFMSGYSDERLTRAREQSTIPFLKKPFGVQSLMRAVRATLDTQQR